MNTDQQRKLEDQIEKWKKEYNRETAEHDGIYMTEHNIGRMSMLEELEEFLAAIPKDNAPGMKLDNQDYLGFINTFLWAKTCILEASYENHSDKGAISDCLNEIDEMISKLTKSLKDESNNTVEPSPETKKEEEI